MPIGTNAVASGAGTMVSTDRGPGVAGPAPVGDHIEISWARCGDAELVVKGGGGDHRDALSREAEVLRRCTGLPVVDFVEVADGPDHTELVTARFGSVTLADAALLDPEERGRALDSLCFAVDRLHGAGWAHGALDASHVLVDPGAGIRLCSLARAVEVPTTDAGVPADARLADDDALATIVEDVLALPAGFDSPRARWRWSRAAARASKRLGASRGLRDAAQVREVLRAARLPGTGEAPAPRTTEPSSAQSVAVGPAPADEGAPEPDHRDPGNRPGRSPLGLPRGIVAAAAAAVVLGAIGARAIGSGSGPAPSPAPEGPASDEPDADEPDADEPDADEPGADEPGAGDTGPEPCSEVDGDPACGRVQIEGNTVVVDGTPLQAGEPGDVLRLGDWDCDGLQHLALLRPTTGEVFVFAGWATEATPLEGRFAGVAPGAVDLAEPTACGPPVVRLADGSAARLSHGPDAGPRGDEEKEEDQ